MHEASAEEVNYGHEVVTERKRRSSRGYVLPLDYANQSSGDAQPPRRRRRRKRRSRYGAVETFFAFSAVWMMFVAALVLAEAMADLDLFFIREVAAPILDRHGWLVGSNVVTQEGGMAAVAEAAGIADQYTAPLEEARQSEIRWGRVIAAILIVPFLVAVIRAIQRRQFK